MRCAHAWGSASGAHVLARAGHGHSLRPDIMAQPRGCRVFPRRGPGPGVCIEYRIESLARPAGRHRGVRLGYRGLATATFDVCNCNHGHAFVIFLPYIRDMTHSYHSKRIKSINCARREIMDIGTRAATRAMAETQQTSTPFFPSRHMEPRRHKIHATRHEGCQVIFHLHDGAFRSRLLRVRGTDDSMMRNSMDGAVVQCCLSCAQTWCPRVSPLSGNTSGSKGVGMESHRTE